MNRIIKMDYLGICNNEQVCGLLSYTVDYNKWTDDVERSVIMKDLFKKLSKTDESNDTIFDKIRKWFKK